MDRETRAERSYKVPEVLSMDRGGSGGRTGVGLLGNRCREWCRRTRETPRSLVSLLERLIYPFCLIVSWESSRPDDHASMEARGPIGVDSLGNRCREWCGRTRETPRSLVSLLESLIYPFCLIVSWESSRPDDHASMEARETAWADFTTRADLHVKPQWLEVSWLLWEMTGPGGVI